MTSDVTENKHSTINIWARYDESNLTMTVLGGILFTMFEYMSKIYKNIQNFNCNVT